MGVLQAVEAVQHLTGVGDTLVNKLVMFDALNLDITVLDISKDPGCILCGNSKLL